MRTLFLLVVAVAIPACAQEKAGGNGGQTAASGAASSNATTAGKLTFEVASVRPSTQNALSGWDFFTPGSNKAPPAGGLFSWDVPLSWLISFAYDIRGPQESRSMMESLPKWAQALQGYRVEARAEGNPTREDVRQMVRSLLEERFQLAAHLEKRDGQVYALVLGKPGSGMKPHPEGTPCALTPAQTNENAYPHAYPSYKVYPVRCGVFNRALSRAGDRRLEMLDVKAQQIAVSLPVALEVVDQTGLTGHYDAVLDFGQRGMTPLDGDTSDDLGLPELPAALEKQLGLKLVKQNAQVDVFVLDHIAPLSEN